MPKESLYLFVVKYKINTRKKDKKRNEHERKTKVDQMGFNKGRPERIMGKSCDVCFSRPKS